ncbi:hypothetical protein DL764_008024 [Monosporascus ibericus]|uniref:Inner kinetochore subunit AME1 domain-containing protein n=1 Tax=Monosporascus ibericus TaxID=155417 RepID=A0A4V1X9D6_9PEZI|nr:hypothetical protein DL764_008024 [Monosporascus ibericus]
MAASREERMQQRMRGAGRHEVADDSFNFVLPVAEESPHVSPPAPAYRTEPNTSAKRRRLNPEDPPASTLKGSSVSRVSARLSALRVQSSPVPTPSQSLESLRIRSSASRASARLNPPTSDPYDIVQQAPSVDDVLQDVHIPTLREGGEEDGEGQGEGEEEGEDDIQAEDDELESLPAAVPVPGSHSSLVSRLSAGLGITEEVTESPAEAPGSGHRRRIRLSNAAATQSARLQRAVMEEELRTTSEMTTSSPLARKTRKSATTPAGLPTRPTRASSSLASSPAIQADEASSPTTRPPRKINSMAASGSTRSVRSHPRRSTLSTIADEEDELSSPLAQSTSSARKPQPKAQSKSPSRSPDHVGDVPQSDADIEQAEEIDAHEAARRIGRKRPRASPAREESPELTSERVEDVEPAKKRLQKRAQQSPAKQAQPKIQKPKGKPSVRRRKDGEAIPITVQRYTKHAHLNEDDTDADILNSDIPFANRGGVNVIDVLAQMCDEVIESSLETLHQAAAQAADSAAKKEFRTKLRAIEAFQEELRTRLLEHTIALDTMHALKKRVRSVQKEKLALRSEILRIRAEREQVALKMDAVRIRHEREDRESLHLLNLSSAMHDIELAVDNGRSAPELGPKDKKAADLANLELLISRVAGEATPDGDGGGNLQQIKEFNAFLERAAAALEGR